MTRLLTATALAALLAAPAFAQVSEECRSVRFADVGWTDITATTAAAGWCWRRSATSGPPSVLVGAGDLYLAREQGHRRLPRQLDADDGGRHRPLPRGRHRRDRGAISTAQNTRSPSRAAPARRPHSFADIAGSRKLDNKIYGIEPGNDGNRLIQEMIDERRLRAR